MVPVGVWSAVMVALATGLPLVSRMIPVRPDETTPWAATKGASARPINQATARKQRALGDDWVGRVMFIGGGDEAETGLKVGHRSGAGYAPLAWSAKIEIGVRRASGECRNGVTLGLSFYFRR